MRQPESILLAVDGGDKMGKKVYGSVLSMDYDQAELVMPSTKDLSQMDEMSNAIQG